MSCGLHSRNDQQRKHNEKQIKVKQNKRNAMVNGSIRQ
jgi:hypothetical protein